MDILQLWSATRCLHLRLQGQLLQGVTVQGGVARFFLRGRVLLVAFQQAPLGLWWEPWEGQKLPGPAGSAAIVDQKLRGFVLEGVELPWADRTVAMHWRKEGWDRQVQRWTIMAECFGGRGALLLLDEADRIWWSSRWDSWEEKDPRLLPRASYRRPADALPWADDLPLGLLIQPSLRSLLVAEPTWSSWKPPEPCGTWWSWPEGKELPAHPLRIVGDERPLLLEELLRWPRKEPDAASHPDTKTRILEQQRLRLERRRQRLQEDLQGWEAEDGQHRRLAMALFQVPNAIHGGGSIRIPDYRTDGIGELVVDLPAGVSLHGYAQKLLHQAQRAQRGRLRARQELSKLEAQLAALTEENVQAAANCATPLESQKKKSTAVHAIDERELEGFRISWGKNAKANEYLTFRLARPQDIWLHVQDHTGSHVILHRRPGETVPEAILYQAAQLALQHSSCKAQSAEVDWTEVRHVQRHPQGGPGRVLYRKFQSLRVRRPGSEN
ncbi:MAG: DUF814 domain-containing protein [Acidithiobacillus sp.]|nr:DUF814 domain-containing protein [Acidithiobacillus sp.]